MVLVKNWQFFHLYILGNIGEENVFHDIVEWKEHFLDHKSNYLKGKFFKRGKSVGLVKNCQFLPFFIVDSISQENVF